MAVINTNIAATLTANALVRNERAATQAMERLSTGLRINSAADDAAGLSMSETMTAQIRGLDMAAKNANDAISMVQTADGATVEIGNMMQRMRELAVQAVNGTQTAADLDGLDLEYQALLSEIDRIAEATQFNGTAIITGAVGSSGTVTYQVGADAAQTVTVAFGDFNTAALTINGGDVDTATNAAAAITALDTDIAALALQRGTYGASINRLEYTVDNLNNISMNTQASRSRIEDADYASESTELARTQIVAQAGTAMLAQANQAAQQVLALLK